MFAAICYTVAVMCIVCAVLLKRAQVAEKKRHEEILARGIIAAANAQRRKGEKNYSAHTGGRRAGEAEWRNPHADA